MNDEFLYLNEHSISNELCNDIIKYFEEDNELWYEGVTSLGLNKNVKNTFDLQINGNDNLNKKWEKIRNFLFNELNININRYIKKLKNKPQYKPNNFNLLNNKYIIETLQMQKYLKNEGIFNYHNDFSITNNTHRIITYIWYLNDVDIGGETEITGNIQIKPKTGSLFLFPATWTYPHCGKMPISNDKYIITGWVYMEN